MLIYSRRKKVFCHRHQSVFFNVRFLFQGRIFFFILFYLYLSLWPCNRISTTVTLSFVIFTSSNICTINYRCSVRHGHHKLRSFSLLFCFVRMVKKKFITLICSSLHTLSLYNWLTYLFSLENPILYRPCFIALDHLFYFKMQEVNLKEVDENKKDNHFDSFNWNEIWNGIDYKFKFFGSIIYLIELRQIVFKKIFF